MILKNLKPLAIALAILSTGIVLTGCSDSDNGDNIVSNDRPQQDTNSNSVSEGVEGPLDALQIPLSEDVFGQLTAATTGTPLEGVLDCAGQAVIIDLLDVVDSIALGLIEASEGGDPTQALSNASENIQLSIEELANDLPGALTALAGDDCNGPSGDGNGGFTGGDNPLSGTPLEALGDALAPVLAGLPASNNDAGGTDMDLQSLSAFMHELSLAFQGGLAQVPSEAREAPIFGGILSTLETAFIDLDNTLMPLGVYDGEATAAALEVTLNHLLVNTLTEIIPLNFIEAQADLPEGQITGPIEEGINLATAGLGDNLLSVALPELADALNGPLSPVLGPIENQVLPAILGPITDALAGDGGDSASGPTGTPLDLLLGPITAALGGGDGGTGGPTGTPLDLILGPLLNAFPV